MRLFRLILIRLRFAHCNRLLALLLSFRLHFSSIRCCPQRFRSMFLSQHFNFACALLRLHNTHLHFGVVPNDPSITITEHYVVSVWSLHMTSQFVVVHIVLPVRLEIIFLGPWKRKPGLPVVRLLFFLIATRSSDSFVLWGPTVVLNSFRSVI